MPFFGPFAPTFRRRQLGVVERSAAGRMLNNVIEPIERLIPVRARHLMMGTGQLLVPLSTSSEVFLLGLHVLNNGLPCLS